MPDLDKKIHPRERVGNWGVGGRGRIAGGDAGRKCRKYICKLLVTIIVVEENQARPESTLLAINSWRLV